MSKENDINLKPSILNTIYDIEKRLKISGLDEDDILVLIQKRIKGKPSKRLIKQVLNGLKLLEKDLIKNKKLNLER